LKEHGSHLPDPEKRTIDDAIAKAREALTGDDFERVKRAHEELEHVSRTLAEVAARRQSATDAGAPREGEVVDAEFVDHGQG